MLQDPGFSSDKILNEYNRLNSINWQRVEAVNKTYRDDDEGEPEDEEEKIPLENNQEDGFYEGEGI